jgi:drug/metabolite transporter (DMT)-like permease
MRRPAVTALGSALLFGATIPAAKAVLGTVEPVALAGLLYLGCGLGLGLGLVAGGGARERWAGFERREIGWLSGAIVCGGIAAPVSLLWGLTQLSASAASLLLSLEGAFTAVLASLLFREYLGGRVAVALLLLTFGAISVGWSGWGAGEVAGILAVSGATLLWALDNNLTREIAHADAVTIATIKGLVAGAVNLSLAGLWQGLPLALAVVAVSLFIGTLGYGASLVLYIRALRDLGSARTGAYFATAPFIGAVLGVALLGEPLTLKLVLAAVLMAGGTVVLLRESHSHVHRHERLAHRHAHVSDLHHRHAHEGSEGPDPHDHWHQHEETEHAHPHVPDLHHRHLH